MRRVDAPPPSIVGERAFGLGERGFLYRDIRRADLPQGLPPAEQADQGAVDVDRGLGRGYLVLELGEADDRLDGIGGDGQVRSLAAIPLRLRCGACRFRPASQSAEQIERIGYRYQRGVERIDVAVGIGEHARQRFRRAGAFGLIADVECWQLRTYRHAR